jgi:hypothetical protein
MKNLISQKDPYSLLPYENILEETVRGGTHSKQPIYGFG